ncbi:MAG: hypothetical protein RLY31_2697 [Bacteroidota bacterium]|jgi:hypothetical protein
MSYKFLAKNGPLLGFGISILCILIAVIPILGGQEALSLIPEKQQAFSPEGNIFYPSIYVAGFLLIASVALAVLLSLAKVLTNLKASTKGLLGFGLLVVLFLAFYATASSDIPESLSRFEVSDAIYKVVGAGITLTMTLGFGSVLLIVLMELWGFVKNK